MDGRTRLGNALREARKAEACDLRRRGFRIAMIADRLNADPATVSMWCAEGGIPPAGYVDQYAPLAKSDDDLYTWGEAEVVISLWEMVRDGEVIAAWDQPSGEWMFRRAP